MSPPSDTGRKQVVLRRVCCLRIVHRCPQLPPRARDKAGPGRYSGKIRNLMDAPQARDGEPQSFRAPYRILVVDDNKDAAESLRLLLQILGGDVRTAYDGVEALQLAEQFLPHAIVLDIGLPKLDGYSAARHIRAQAWGKETVLVAVSGWCRDEDRLKSVDAGFNGHLAKPVDAEQIRNMIQDFLDGASPSGT
jgi:CheY-like chemotaxis protein